MSEPDIEFPPRFIPFLLLARAYYLSSSHDPDNLDKAEASLNELIDTIDSAADRVGRLHRDVIRCHPHILLGAEEPRASTASMDESGCPEETPGSRIAIA